MIKVCKFGGTSLADGTTMLRVKEIVESDPARRYIVVSAPGKRFSADSKITDLLYQTARECKETGSVGEAYAKVSARFQSIVHELDLPLPICEILRRTAEDIERENDEDFTASRGEYLAGIVMASLLGAAFIDPRTVVKFKDGRLDPRSYILVREAVKGKRRAVVAGFYGEDENGKVRTLSRGGSDVSGAIVARAVMADEYENWTDVSGFLACDPHIVPSPAGIGTLTYRELRELSYMGANVLHSESMFPVREANIPIHIRNTFRPQDEGTRIVPESKYRLGERVVTGIAGKKNFTVVYMEKSLMNAEIGFTHKVLGVLTRHGISFEHLPSGIDTMSLVIDSEVLKDGELERVEEEIGREAHPDHIRAFGGVSLIAVVGEGMSRNVGTSARLFRAIAEAGVNVRMIDQGSSEINIIVGVDNENYERTVKAIYEEFFLASE